MSEGGPNDLITSYSEPLEVVRREPSEASEPEPRYSNRVTQALPDDIEPEPMRCLEAPCACTEGWEAPSEPAPPEMSRKKKRFINKYPSLKLDLEEFALKYDEPTPTVTEESEKQEDSESDGEDNIQHRIRKHLRHARRRV